MLVVISPAKKLNMDALPEPWQGGDGLTPTTPMFQARAENLAQAAKQLTADDLQKIMGISASLAELNAERFSAFGNQTTKPAGLAFAGDTYQGLEAASLDEHEWAWAQNHLRILSGLYGVLRPLDLMEPYRLEMGSRFAPPHGKSLYEYWGRDLADALNEQAQATGSRALVNCASQEYFRAVDQEALALPVITPVFKDVKNGSAKVINFFAKKARGAMARFIIQNRIADAEGLKMFSGGGYQFVADQSDSTTLTFIR